VRRRYLACPHVPTAILTTLSTRHLSELASRRPHVTIPQGHYEEWESKEKRTALQGRILLAVYEKVRLLMAPGVVD